MHRGEIWRAELDSPIGRRPVLLLSRNSAYEVRTSITIAPITRTIRDIPSYVKLDQKDGMPVKCAVDLDDIATVPKERLTEKITELSPDRMQDILHAITYALDLKV